MSQPPRPRPPHRPLGRAAWRSLAAVALLFALVGSEPDAITITVQRPPD